MWCFELRFTDDDIVTQFQVNQERDENDEATVTEAEALAYAESYGEACGRMPKLMRKELYYVFVHGGNPDPGIVAGSRILVLHTGTVEEDYIADGFLDEGFLQNFVHVGLTEF